MYDKYNGPIFSNIHVNVCHSTSAKCSNYRISNPSPLTFYTTIAFKSYMYIPLTFSESVFMYCISMHTL